MGKYHVHQTDANQKAIVAALKAGGCDVEPLGRPLDLLVAKRGQNVLVEVKLPKGKLRPSQEKFIARWRGPIVILRSVEEAIEFLGQ